MYTQCPDCATVFRVTAEALRAAQGDVRCGVCSTSFNALENLSEQPFRPADESPEALPDDSMTVEELPGSENIELSSPDELVTASAPPSDDEERAMEFHGDAADLDRLFVVETPDLDRTDEHPILVLDEQDDPEPVESIVLETTEPSPMPAPPMPAPPVHAPPPPPAPAPPRHATGAHTAPRILIPDEMRKRLAEDAAARAAAAELDLVEQPGALLSKRWPWVAGIATLGLLFVLQVVHGQRNDLIRSPVLGPVIAGAYALFGLSPLAPSDLSAYELRQWGAASDPNEAGRLLLRASIVNRASYAQPLPLLRLVLQDRFGGTLGMRDIGPADYLPGTGLPRQLQAGERADALIRIVDPGPEAVGFEIDVCLPAQGGVRCANPMTTASQ